MTVCLPVEVPAAPAQRSDVAALLDQLTARARSAEDKVAHLERALASNRRIGMAVGILMCQLQLTEDQAIAELRTASQHRNVKVRELAETVIYIGRL
jgi:AmiR/NasT family two-component response regulator